MKQPIRLSILGDVNTQWGWREAFERGNAAEVFGDILPELQNSDISIANLELPLTDHEIPSVKTGPCLKGKPSDLKVLKEAGFSALSLANNHILDYGFQGLLDTLETAEKEAFPVFGAGRTAADAAKPLFLEKNGWKIGFISFAEEEFNIAYQQSPGANLFDPYYSLSAIRAAKGHCDYLIVLYHGGIEHYIYPSPLLQKKCRTMAEYGADLVLCQHSHCIGTMETFDGGTILYGQGNAVFGKRAREQWNLGMLVSVELSESENSVSYRVFEAGEKGISFCPEEKNSDRLNQIESDSRCLSDADSIREKWDAFCRTQEPEYLPLLFGWGRVRGKLNRMLKGKPAEHFVGKKKKMITMNLVRCDAHREVVQTILENSQK